MLLALMIFGSFTMSLIRYTFGDSSFEAEAGIFGISVFFIVIIYMLIRAFRLVEND